MEAVSKIQKIFKIEESASTGISYLIKVLFYLLGFKFIWSKMVPVSTKEEKEDNYRKPPTLFLWLIAILLQNGFPLLDIEKKDENEYNEKLINFYETQEWTDFLNYLINYYYMKNKDLWFR